MDQNLQPRLLAHLQQVARPRHAQWDPLGLMGVRAYIHEQLSALGKVEEHHFSEAGEAGTNLILRLPGRNSALPPLLVGAHYDTPPLRPVWIVAFDKEEWGMLGSRALARELRFAKQSLQLMVSLEMLAYTADEQAYPLPGMERIYGDRGDFIALVANVSAALLLPSLARAMGSQVCTKVLPVPLGGRLLPDVRLSDHSPFWDQGYNALMVTDTSFMRNPHYHWMSDTIDTLDLPFFCAVVNGLDAAMAVL